jgi:Na+-driven multidrug efflux pump
MSVFAGVLIWAIVLPLLDPLLMLFGSTEAMLPYAREYAFVITLGLIFHLVSGAVNMCIHADGSPGFAMIATVSGAILNIILDPIFIKVLNLGMAGAAIATVIGYFVSMLVSLSYLKRFKHVKIKLAHLKLSLRICGRIIALGGAGFLNQMAGVVTMVVINQSLRHYGALSEYGADYIIAAMGIAVKMSQLVFGVIIGMCFVAQPLLGFNSGAKHPLRLKNIFKETLRWTLLFSAAGLALLQIFPRHIAGMFGSTDPLYTESIVLCIRYGHFSLVILSFSMMVTHFFQDTGQPLKAAVLSMSRQFAFLLPSVFIMPLIMPAEMGLQGVLLALPVSHILTALLGGGLMVFEWKKLTRAHNRQVEEGVPIFP